MSPRKREPAKWIFAKELKDSVQLEEKDPDEKGKPYVITPLGTRSKRVLLTGTVTSKNSEENLTKVAIADATGTFYVNAFANDFNIEQKTALDSLEPDNTVTIMGRINPFKTDDGVFYFNINPELVVRSDSISSDFWNMRTAYVTMRKLFAIREALKGSTTDKESLIKLGYSQEEAEDALRAKELYSEYDYTRFQELAQGVIDSLMRPSQSAESKTFVLEYVRNNDTDGKGCKYEDIVIAGSNKGMEQTEVDEILNALGSEGEIYEVSLKRYKAL